MKFNNQRKRHRVVTNNEYKLRKLYFLECEGVTHVMVDPYILYAKNIREPELKVLKCYGYQ